MERTLPGKKPQEADIVGQHRVKAAHTGSFPAGKGGMQFRFVKNLGPTLAYPGHED